MAHNPPLSGRTGVAIGAGRFDLTGAALGPRNVLVEAGAGSQVVDTVEVEALRHRDLVVGINARNVMREGFSSSVVLSVTNLGNENADLVPIFLDGIPGEHQVEGRFAEIVPTDDVVEQVAISDLVDYGSLPVSLPNADGTQVVPLLVPRVPPGSTVYVPLRITLAFTGELQPFTMRAWAFECLDSTLDGGGLGAGSSSGSGAVETGDFDGEACLTQALEVGLREQFELIPSDSCAGTGWAGNTSFEVAEIIHHLLLDGASKAASGSSLWMERGFSVVAQVVATCAGIELTADQIDESAQLTSQFTNDVPAIMAQLDKCDEPRRRTVEHRVDQVTSRDPNAKVGPQGAGAEGFIHPGVVQGGAGGGHGRAAGDRRDVLHRAHRAHRRHRAGDRRVDRLRLQRGDRRRHVDQHLGRHRAGNREFVPDDFEAGTTVSLPCGPGTLGPFSDVSGVHLFCQEITWLVGTGVTVGYSDSTYRPSTSVTRGAMAAFLYRFASLCSQPALRCAPPANTQVSYG